jgi:hypothetical protein
MLHSAKSLGGAPRRVDEERHERARVGPPINDEHRNVCYKPSRSAVDRHNVLPMPASSSFVD